MMEFHEQLDLNYSKWLISKNEAFAIGILDYLFGQKCIQILYREVPKGHWWVIQEWRTYNLDLVDALISDIIERLMVINADFGQWQRVESALPEKQAKYLEDEPAVD